MPSSSRRSSRAEKRVLWEVRRRHQIGQRAGGRSTRAAVTRPVPARPGIGRAGGGEGPPVPRMGEPPGRGVGRWVRRGLLVIALAAVLSGGVFGYKILAAGNKVTTADRSIIGQLADLLFSEGRALEGEAEGQINILLMAIGGEGHSGENLTDSIMVVSIQPTTGKVALLSIPRDLYVQVPNEDYFSKINAVHAQGESIKRGQGPVVLAGLVEEITGLPIHYYGRIDFIAFKKIVDAIGGVDITIENSFFDYWHKISFGAGTERMDGERALAYVRARYIEGPEGGDFKRAERTQQVLIAIRDKVFSTNTALDFTALNSILNSVSDDVRTDMQLWEMRRFYELARGIQQEGVHSVVLTTGPRGVLVGTTEVLGGTPASVLKTRTGDYGEVRELVAHLFDDGTAMAQAAPTPEAATPTPAATPAEERKPTLEIRNGTNITGLAKSSSDELTGEGYEVLAIGNAGTRDRTETVVYTLNDSFANSAISLAQSLEAESESGLPSGESASKAEVLIILGSDRGS